MTIGYGKTHGPPEGLVEVGQLEDAAQLTTTIVRDPWETSNALDGITDLIAVDQHVITIDDSTTLLRHAVLFEGSGSRVLHTSRPLTDAGQADLPLAVSIAKFSDEAPEIAALGANRVTGKLRLWTIEGAEADLARPGPVFLGAFHSAANTEQITFRYGAIMAAGDLNEDGTDEIVVIAPFGTAADGAAVVIADFNDDDDTFVPRGARPLSALLTVDTKLELQDLDGDGHLDGVFSTGTHEEPGELVVLWGDGQGNLDTNAPAHMRPDGGVCGFACMAIDKGCRVIVSSPSGTYSVHVATGRGLELARIEDLPATTSIATGDFNRDGITDIAVHTLEGLTFFRAIPVNP